MSDTITPGQEEPRALTRREARAQFEYYSALAAEHAVAAQHAADAAARSAQEVAHGQWNFDDDDALAEQVRGRAAAQPLVRTPREKRPKPPRAERPSRTERPPRPERVREPRAKKEDRRRWREVDDQHVGVAPQDGRSVWGFIDEEAEPTAIVDGHLEIGDAPADPIPTDRQANPAKQSFWERRASKSAGTKADAPKTKKDGGSPKLSSRERKLAKENAARAAQEKKEIDAAKKRAERESAARAKALADEAKAAARSEKTGKPPKRKPTKLKGKKVRKATGGTKPKLIDVTNAVRALATVLESSDGELEPIDAMADEFAGTQIGAAFARIYIRMREDNATLVEAFGPEKVFPPIVHNMLRVGAKTVSPGSALREAVTLMDQNDDSKRKLRKELGEPITVGLISVLSLFGTAWLVMPQFVTMYKAIGKPVGPISQAVLILSDVLVWVMGIAAVIAVLWGIYWFVYARNSYAFRLKVDRWKLHMPLMGNANITAVTHQVLNILKAYLTVGATEREALLDTASAVDNRAVREHLRVTADALVTGEKTFAELFDSELFPPLARRLMAAGQRAGKTVDTIVSLEATYRREAAVAGEQGVAAVVGTVTAVSTLIYVVVVSMVTVPPLEVFGATLSMGS